MDNLISVIVPIYNVEQYLNECIESIVNQTYKNLEIILVDDGSPDNCAKICDNWKERDYRIKVIHKKNGGLSDARNAGLDIARGDFISFIDSDDWIDLKMYEILLDVILKENAEICACGIMECLTSGYRKVKVEKINGSNEQIYKMLYNDTIYPVSAWNKLYRKECWSSLRFPIGKICEDAFTTYKLIDQASKIVQIDAPLYFYRIRENSIMTSSFSKKKMENISSESRWNCEFICKF